MKPASKTRHKLLQGRTDVDDTRKAKAAAKKAAKEKGVSVQAKPKTKKMVIESLNISSIGEVVCEIEGTSPLVINRFSEKAKKAIAEKQQGKTKAKKPPKDPEGDFLAALYVEGNRPKKSEDLKKTRIGFPDICFKCAIVDAAKFSDFAMKDIKRLVFTHGDFVDAQGISCVDVVAKNVPEMREDPAPVGMSGMDLRYRPMFREWGATLRISFNARMVTAEQVVSLVMDSGMGGVGEMRPNGKKSTGTCGMYKVVKATATVPDFSSEEKAA